MISQLLPFSPSGVQIAADLLRAGDLVAFPTETVYGLGADARRDDAVAKIFDAKGRPSGNPVIVHVADIAAAQACVAAGGWNEHATAVARNFWPGPLTIILFRGSSISPLVSAGRNTVALRVPAHPVAQALLQEFNGPVAAPSANRSGFVSPTTAGHVFAELAGRVPLIIDGAGTSGGDCIIGLESTVLDLTVNPPTILRPGAITLDMLKAHVPNVALRSIIVDPSQAAASPGLHAKHYAPRTPANRFDSTAWPQAASFAATHAPVVLLTWSDAFTLPAPHHTLRLPFEGAAYARAFYAALRDADALNANAILVLAPPGGDGIWTAVTDRLRRATLELP